MSLSVVPLHPELACADIVKALRNIADDVEAGRYDFEPNMAVVVLGMDHQRQDRDGISIRYAWQTHGLGKNATYMAAKGLLASALGSFDGGSDAD